jgi:hypothetical protein
MQRFVAAPDAEVRTCTRKCRGLCLHQMQGFVPAPDATVCTCTRCRGSYLHQMQRFVPAPNTRVRNAPDVGLCTCTRCQGLYMHQMQGFVPAPDAGVCNCARCNDLYFHQMQKFVTAPDAGVVLVEFDRQAVPSSVRLNAGFSSLSSSGGKVVGLRTRLPHHRVPGQSRHRPQHAGVASGVPGMVIS